MSLGIVIATTVEDPAFGPVRIRVDGDEGVAEVTGPGLPPAVVRRALKTALKPSVPIGTRDAAALTLTVGGSPAGLSLGKGRFTRRSYAVEAAHEGHAYRLVPRGETFSRLSLDGAVLGDFTSPGHGRPGRAAWKPRAKVLPRDAAIGYVLTAAFGTGAKPLSDGLAEAGGSVFDIFS
ncbi:hypothetical protein B7P34_26010 [Streptosporangium nondiastaticum]|uniref:Uncharacterized protein n=1 Tax=Streptosporangium nondiastaticum TaxID=35764 RepID=A0A9X7JLJ3_9ACTN|nr:hypothetical protein [Streptosporangium nondiastaticum]PSJ25847.1 hypothetical protein B7P34_26010 [Streptosporangium nondiastaticum]